MWTRNARAVWLALATGAIVLLTQHAEAALADEYIGTDASGAAIYIAWTADYAGHLQGQVQIVSPDSSASHTKVINAAFTGIRHGSDVSLAFPFMSEFSGSTWTGHLGWRHLTLNLPSNTGTPIIISLSIGSIGDFQRRAAALQSRAATAQQSDSDQRFFESAISQFQNAALEISRADAFIHKVFPMPAPAPDNPRSYHGMYMKAWDKMQHDWAHEQDLAKVDPMTCYQKSQVSYAASIVNYDRALINTVDSQTNNFKDQASSAIDIATKGPQTIQELAALVQMRASAIHVNASLRVNILAVNANADKAAAYARNIAAPRLRALLKSETTYDAQAAALQTTAMDFPNTVQCGN